MTDSLVTLLRKRYHSLVGKKKTPSSSILFQSATSLSIIGLSLRRAILIDWFFPTKLDLIVFHDVIQSHALLYNSVYLFFHRPSQQTFIINLGLLLQSDLDHLIWVDVKVPSSSSLPSLIPTSSTTVLPTRLTTPSSHLQQLVSLILDFHFTHLERIIIIDTTTTTNKDSISIHQSRLVGIALAGWLLEYRCIYSLEFHSSSSSSLDLDYQIISSTSSTIQDSLFLQPEPFSFQPDTNSLSFQPLVLFQCRIHTHPIQYELQAFSIPKTLVSHQQVVQIRKDLEQTIQLRISNAIHSLQKYPLDLACQFSPLLESATVHAQVSSVQLDRVAL